MHAFFAAIPELLQRVRRLNLIGGERVCPDHPGPLLDGHLENYSFMAQFVDGAAVLDIGCGYGYGTDCLMSSGARWVCGIDYSRAALRYARRRYRKTGLTFRHMNAESLDFPDASFDVVTSLENIEHLPHPEKCIAETRRVLRPKGLFLLATPNKEISSPGLARCPNPHHLREFDYIELNALLRSHYADTAIFETQYAGSSETQRLQTERRRLNQVGIAVQGQTHVQVGPYRVVLEHCRNSHSFLAMAWGRHEALPRQERRIG